MSRRPSLNELSRHLQAPTLPTRIGVAAAVLVGVLAARQVLNIFTPGVAPFSLLYPAVLLATLAVGWAPGLAVMVIGGGYAWFAVVQPHGADGGHTPAQVVSLIVYLASAGGIVVFAEAHRAAGRRLALEDARRISEREGLIESQQQLFENARGFMAVLRGPDYVFEFVNDAYRQLVGDRPLVGLTMAEAIPEIMDGLIEDLDRARMTGEPLIGHETPFHLRRIAGGPLEARFVDVVFQPIREADGSIERMFVEGFDITEIIHGQAALRESEARLEMATATAGVGVWEWRILTGEVIYSAQARSINGFTADEPMTLARVTGAIHPEDFPGTEARARRALDPAVRESGTYEHRIMTPDGEERWVVANGRAVFELVGGVETATRYVGTLQDVTADKLAERERVRSAAGLRLAVDAGRMAVWQIDVQQGMTESPELARMLGLPETSLPTLEEVNGLYMPGERDRVRKVALEALAQGERFFEVEFQVRRPDGQMRWLLVRAELVANDTGGLRGATGVVMDVTDRKDSEERLKLLAREVDHRANNMLAVVQGTVRLSQAATPEALKTVLVGRVSALARAHQLLSEARWQGADLGRLVGEELAAFGPEAGDDGPRRVDISGPEVALAPAAAQGLAMALHELATNAAKYGGLSTPGGRVAVSWTREPEGPLKIRWVETGGPAATAPERKGLGSTILARSLAGPLKGETTMDWRFEGLICDMSLPAKAVDKQPMQPKA